MRIFFKILFPTVLSFFTLEVAAQKTIDTWYDEHWVDTHVQLARYFSRVEHTDSGWYRKDVYVATQKWQMLGLYEDQACTLKNGVFRYFYPNGNLKSLETYAHNKKAGLHLSFFEDGTLKDSAFYLNGHVKGEANGWYKNGNQSFKIIMDDNGNGIVTKWFPDGQPSEAGRLKNFDGKNGRWQYFHSNGKVSGVELYEMGLLKSYQYFNEDGSPEEDTVTINRPLSFPGGTKAWSKYIDGQIFFPEGLDVKNGYRAVLLITATIDENGKVTDVLVDLPLNPRLDKIAINALLKSPKWIPAKEHNRRVSSTFSQYVSFERSYD
jgi:hypothetical protein